MIWTLLLGFLSSLWQKFMGYIIGAGIIMVAIATVFLKGRASGKRVYREKHEKANKKALERTKAVVKRINDASPEEVKAELKYYD